MQKHRGGLRGDTSYRYTFKSLFYGIGIRNSFLGKSEWLLDTIFLGRADY